MNLLGFLLLSVLRADFPELAGSKIGLRAVPLEGGFLQARVEPRSLLSASRSYWIYYDPRLLEDPPPKEALSAILAHELAHVEDYSRRSAPGLAVLALRYLISPGFRAEYERSADRRAAALGHSAGLAAYRGWLYRRLPKEEPRLRREYMTPEELEPGK